MTELPGTLPERERSSAGCESPHLMGLAVAFSSDEPDRVGEVALIASGPDTYVLGRGRQSPDHGRARLAFARMRDGRLEPRPPLASPHLSREQLHVRCIDMGGTVALEMENRGRLRLEHNGTQRTRLIARAGDTVQLGSQFLFLIVRRRLPVPLRTASTCPSF